MQDELLTRMVRLSHSPGGRVKCKVAEMLDKLPTSDVDIQVREALKSEKVTGSALATVMRAEGFDISAYSVRRHRRGECACGRNV